MVRGPGSLQLTTPDDVETQQVQLPHLASHQVGPNKRFMGIIVTFNCYPGPCCFDGQLMKI